MPSPAPNATSEAPNNVPERTPVTSATLASAGNESSHNDILVEGPDDIKVWLQNKMIELTSQKPNKRDSVSIRLVKSALVKPRQSVEQALSDWLSANFTKVSQKARKAGGSSTITNSSQSVLVKRISPSAITPSTMANKKLAKALELNSTKRLRTFTIKTGQHWLKRYSRANWYAVGKATWTKILRWRMWRHFMGASWKRRSITSQLLTPRPQIMTSTLTPPLRHWRYSRLKTDGHLPHQDQTV